MIVKKIKIKAKQPTSTVTTVTINLVFSIAMIFASFTNTVYTKRKRLKMKTLQWLGTKQRQGRTNSDLHNAGTIPKINKRNTTVHPMLRHPPAKPHPAPSIRLGQLSAVIRPPHPLQRPFVLPTRPRRAKIGRLLRPHRRRSGSGDTGGGAGDRWEADPAAVGEAETAGEGEEGAEEGGGGGGAEEEKEGHRRRPKKRPPFFWELVFFSKALSVGI